MQRINEWLRGRVQEPKTRKYLHSRIPQRPTQHEAPNRMAQQDGGEVENTSNSASVGQDDRGSSTFLVQSRVRGTFRVPSCPPSSCIQLYCSGRSYSIPQAMPEDIKKTLPHDRRVDGTQGPSLFKNIHISNTASTQHHRLKEGRRVQQRRKGTRHDTTPAAPINFRTTACWDNPGDELLYHNLREPMGNKCTVCSPESSAVSSP